jgi:Lrp/AsnC family transcriptional regulator, regulator for asnA, asnC and gidA
MPPTINHNTDSAVQGKLTALERDILQQLMHDPHASNREIGEALGLSISQVGTRIRRLEQQQFAHVFAVLDLPVAGLSTAFVFITVCGRPIEDVAGEIAAIREAQTVTGIVLCEFDLMVMLRFRDLAHLDALINERIAVITGCSYLMCAIVLETLRFTQEFMVFSAAGLPPHKGGMLAELRHELQDSLADDLDLNIIAELQADGRCTSERIARNQNVSAGTVRNRIRSMEARGLMRFVTVIDPSAVGLNAAAIVMIDVDSSKLKEALDELRQIESMHYLFSCTGTFGVIGFMIVKDLDDARNIVSSRVRTIAGVKTTKMSPLVDTHRNDPRWSYHAKGLIASVSVTAKKT